ncbi:MAG: hypothetical protein EAX95_03095 [Candidatus Thorarchaeota archaeon]|nr:hypothetical protein [Candidatus Thorarchaeota archaeon]
MGWKEAVQVILFILSWAPIGLLAGTTIAGVGEVYGQDFSIYNEGWNGYSEFRTAVNESGYDVKSIQSSMSVLSRYQGSAVLVISGPVIDYSADTLLVMFQHLLAGGGVLIADDFGTSNNSLFLLNQFMQPQIGSAVPGLNFTGLLTFTKGVLLDLDSYDKDPRLPVIRDIVPHPITQGISELHLNWASTLNPTSLMGYFGVAWTTDRAWVEPNIDDPNPWPDEGEMAGVLPVAGAIDLSASFPGAGRLVALSDPSIFSNDMWDRFSDNQRFGLNIINWLAQGQRNYTIAFSENLLAVPWNSPEFFFGLYLGRALWLSAIPWLAPLYPLITVMGIRKYLPDPKKPEVKSVSEVFLRRGQTYFSERMIYYRTEGNYSRVVKMLYRRLRRDLTKKNRWTEFSVKKLWELMQYKDPKMKQEEFLETISRIEEISSNPGMKVKENEMMELFFFMRNIQSLLIDTKSK